MPARVYSVRYVIASIESAMRRSTVARHRKRCPSGLVSVRHPDEPVDSGSAQPGREQAEGRHRAVQHRVAALGPRDLPRPPQGVRRREQQATRMAHDGERLLGVELLPAAEPRCVDDDGSGGLAGEQGVQVGLNASRARRKVVGDDEGAAHATRSRCSGTRRARAHERARAIRCGADGCVANSTVTRRVRLQIGNVCQGQLALHAGERRRVAGEVRGVHVRAGLDTPAHQVAQRPTDRSQQTEQRQDQRQGRGIRCRHDAGLIEQGLPLQKQEQQADRRGRRHCAEHRAPQDIAVLGVAELVRDDALHLARLGAVEERVEYDDATGRAEPRDVRVERRRPARRVGDEDVLDVHRITRGEIEQRCPEHARRQ